MFAGSRRIIDMQIRSVGIDLGKTTFHLVALSAAGKVLLRKKVVITAAANKLARVAWAVLSSGEEYRPPTALMPS